MSHRYTVEVCFATYRPEGKGFADVSHGFTSRVAAERFAREVSRYLPAKLADGCPIAWVLVYAMASDPGTAVSYGASVCYLSYDPGAVVVKRHDIPRGFYGSSCRACGFRLDVAA